MFRVVAISVCALAIGCGHHGSASDARTLLLTPPSGVDTLQERFRLGIDGEDEAGVVFGGVTDVTADEAGRIWVADILVGQIHIFDSTGALVTTLGRKGKGPGEFGLLSGLASAPSGSVWAMDPSNRRLTRYGPDLTVEATVPVPMGYSTTIPWAGQIGIGDRLYRSEGVGGVRGDERVMRSVISDNVFGATDTVRLARPKVPTYTQERGGVTMQSSVGYSPSVRWAPGPSEGLWSTGETGYRVHLVTFTGDTTRSIRVASEPARLTDRERDSLAYVSGLRGRDIPREKPAIVSFVSDTREVLWVVGRLREYPGRTTFDRIDVAQGEVRRYVVTIRPEAIQGVTLFLDRGLLVTTTDSLGVDHVSLFTRRAGTL